MIRISWKNIHPCCHVTLGMRNPRSLVNTFPFNAAEDHQHLKYEHGDITGGFASNTLANRNVKQVSISTYISFFFFCNV